jgi:hypothetical protein
MIFNRKLKLRIAELEIKLSEQNRQIGKLNTEVTKLKHEMASLSYRLNNPPKFKAGDTVGDFEITNTRFKNINIYESFARVLAIGILNILRPNETSRAIKTLHQMTYPHWEYDVINTKTGDKSIKIESQLI